MSVQGLFWALNQPVFPSTRKFVLVALGNFAGDTGLSYPAVKTISEMTGLHDQTVRDSLDALVADKIVTDTGKRAGNTRQVRVFQLPEEACQRLLSLGVFDGSKTRRRLGEDSEKTTKLSEPPNTMELELEHESVAASSFPELIDRWNKAEGLVSVQNISIRRKKMLTARMKDPFFRKNWREAISKISDSDFCTGKNERRWRADLDFFLRPDSVTQIMEGKYDNQERNSGPNI